ncbi:phosphopantetheine-binding protein [Sulfurimonas sp.]|uniref:phosphopantetheine-binding protein n=1 Tax=Sulfurimonas sp. TaxID=2022749 RepID=UPI002B46196B|nr:phosphopantetheine-binding protein [Sulfurimonas sp.]
MTNEIIFNQIVEILVDEFEVKRTRIKLSSSFYFDLGLDSLDLIDLSLLLEKQTNKVIGVEKLKDVTKIEDIILLFQN